MLQQPELQSIARAEFDVSKIRAGDFILKRGKGPISKMITDNFKEKIPISHCGIFVEKGDSLVIVHSVTEDYGDKDGVQEIPVNQFLLDCSKGFLFVVRFKGEAAKNLAMSERAKHYAQQRIPFDKEVDNASSEKMSCTELLYWCMKDVYEVDYFNRIKIGNKELLGFSNLLDTSKFVRIIEQ